MTYQVPERIMDKVADRIVRRMEEENALPLPQRRFDVVVDDPSLLRAHRHKGIRACSPYAAAVEATRRTVRMEGFRVMASQPVGDEQTVESQAATEGVGMYATVYREGEHPVLLAEAQDRRDERDRKKAESKQRAEAADQLGRVLDPEGENEELQAELEKIKAVPADRAVSPEAVEAAEREITRTRMLAVSGDELDALADAIADANLHRRDANGFLLAPPPALKSVTMRILRETGHPFAKAVAEAAEPTTEAAHIDKQHRDAARPAHHPV